MIMNKRERLSAAVKGEKVDRVPVSVWRHWPGDDQDPVRLAAAHIAFQKEYDWDFIKVSPSSSYCLVDWGVEDRWVGAIEGTREYTKRIVQTPEDWLSLRVLDPNQGTLAQHLRCLELLHAEFGDAVPIIQTIFSPLAQAKNLAGNERLILHMRQNAGQVHHALQTIADSTSRFIQECKARGIAGIYYAIQHASYLMISEPEYEVYGRPYDLQILSSVNDIWFNMLHLHGANSMFGLVADYPVQVLNWHDRASAPDLAAGLKKFKGAVCGGVDRDILHGEDRERLAEQAKDAHQQTGGKRWILGVGCVSYVTTPVGNLRALRSLADELG